MGKIKRGFVVIRGILGNDGLKAGSGRMIHFGIEKFNNVDSVLSVYFASLEDRDSGC